MDEFIPKKRINNKHQIPWVTHKIKKMIRKKNKIHSKLKSSKSAKIMKQYKAIKHRLQKDMRIAYWTYIDNIIDYSEEDNTSERKSELKKFWSFLKLKHKDSSGVAPRVVIATLSPMPPTKQPSSITNLVRYSPMNQEDQCQTKGLSPFPAMPDIDLSTFGIQKS